MSYCRMGDDSDVYAYASFRRFCLHVRRKVDTEQEFISVRTGKEFLAALLDLKARGLKVPDRAIDRIRRELELSP